ncbi:MAG: hypothetical protein MK141_14115 [Pseudoxanthomonas sp.]|jgi:hypothetical protein|uniref:hypothetical protein n=1 Tax=Pseudoxanthomonas sp. TaxID=1871049 RepID=UPI002587A183|nr:hypothetical protein [Pseudoxanthomonas sp.]MCH2092694.1 hypothetical protein [Pseudoxanthomonas sp.]
MSEQAIDTPAARAALRALALVTGERSRQREEKGYTPDHDDQHSHEELAAAAAFYLLPAVYNEDVCVVDRAYGGLQVKALLSLIGAAAWEDISREAGMELELEEPDSLAYRIQVVTVGVALGLAELERLLRMEEAQGTSEEGA